MKLSVIFFLTFSSIVSAEVQTKPGPVTIDYERQEATVYLSIYGPPRKHARFVRVTRKNAVADFFIWNDEPFVLDTRGRLWGLDASFSRKDSAAHIFGEADEKYRLHKMVNRIRRRALRFRNGVLFVLGFSPRSSRLRRVATNGGGIIKSSR
jgi:hypothetical protein